MAQAQEQDLAADVERLRHALKRERETTKKVERTLGAVRGDISSRLAALEVQATRATAQRDLSPVLAGVASIRAELLGELAIMRQELDELHTQVDELRRA